MLKPRSGKYQPSVDIFITPLDLQEISQYIISHTFQNILFHLNLIKLVGADNNTVASEMDTAAGL